MQTSQITTQVDYSQIPPIQQKRIIAFVNHFVTSTVSFLNSFCQLCESRFMEFEYKTQKIEASLLILEAQLSSIQGLDAQETSKELKESSHEITDCESQEGHTSVAVDNVKLSLETSNSMAKEATVKRDDTPLGVKASDDPRFVKFFKMLKFGVQEEAVKLKMQAEGVDVSVLNTPDLVIPEE
ncbi:WASH complex subunit 3 [Euwallacea fornicatus]|uniref:WASH complex subunit 3 n=1 Tax=Euwallacea fornicatus TaxID=995702 RepID=UPI00338F8F2F